MSIRKRNGGPKAPPVEAVAGNGLLHRRALLGGGVMLAGAMTTGASLTGAAAEPLKDDAWSLEMGSVVPAYQVPSRFEKDVIRTRSNPNNEFRNSHARTPHHLLQGTVTPNGLFFSISHSGLPDIDPAQHRLVIHGLVKQPGPVSAVALSDGDAHAPVECSGNSGDVFQSRSGPPRRCTAWCQRGMDRLLLSTLLEETGIDPKANGFAEGAIRSRSIAASVRRRWMTP
jgi:sulfane dehydrogenase subunit SoxC